MKIFAAHRLQARGHSITANTDITGAAKFIRSVLSKNGISSSLKLVDSPTVGEYFRIRMKSPLDVWLDLSLFESSITGAEVIPQIRFETQLPEEDSEEDTIPYIKYPRINLRFDRIFPTGKLLSKFCSELTKEIAQTGPEAMAEKKFAQNLLKSMVQTAKYFN